MDDIKKQRLRHALKDPEKMQRVTKMFESLAVQTELDDLTDEELAEKLMNVWATMDMFSMESSLLQTMIDRLRRAKGPQLVHNEKGEVQPTEVRDEILSRVQCLANYAHVARPHAVDLIRSHVLMNLRAGHSANRSAELFETYSTAFNVEQLNELRTRMLELLAMPYQKSSTLSAAWHELADLISEKIQEQLRTEVVH